MRKLLFLILLCTVVVLPVSASELTAPEAPPSAREYMPEDTASFANGLEQLLRKALALVRPDLKEASESMVAVLAVVLILALLETFSGSTKKIADLAGVSAICAILMSSTNSLIHLGSEALAQLQEYGKLLLPVMTAAMAAQGGITTSAALYTGTVMFNSLLTNLLTKLLIPMVYLFLALAAANAATGEELLKKLRDTAKIFTGWCLKTLLTVFTTYMGITGILSGTTDAAALKAVKITFSTFVPVVGGILSDASEAVLVSAGLARNAAGLYGIFAVLALLVEPFVRIGIHYLLLKAAAALSGIFGTKRMAELIGDFSTAMGLLLAMTGSACVIQLISTICFMKGVS